MADPVAPQLPRGRHGLTREQVETDQRLRIFVAMADAMRAHGYVGTPVAEIIKRAGVSRETFYQLYSDKLSAFLAAFDLVAEVLLDRLQRAAAEPVEPMVRFERALTAYLDTLATEPGYAQLFLVEVHAAGPVAIDRRAAVQQRIADGLAELLAVRSETGRFTCQLLVAAVSAMVTPALVADDAAALRALGPSLLDHVRRLQASGMLGPAT